MGRKEKKKRKKKLEEQNTENKLITLYHGTCKGNAENLLKNGWKPNSGGIGGNMGNLKYLYLTNNPSNALWFAQEKGCNTILELKVLKSQLRVDPEDGIGDTVDEELERKVGNVVSYKEIPSSSFSIYDGKILLEQVRKRFKIKIPGDLRIIYNAYKQAGKDFYLVGGAVRDSLLGKEPKDFDIVTNATPDESISILKQLPDIKVLEVGKAFGVVVAVTLIDGTEENQYEIATFRRDIY